MSQCLITILTLVLATTPGTPAQQTPGKQGPVAERSQEEFEREKGLEKTKKRLEEAKKELAWNPRSAYWHNQAGLLYASLKETIAARNELQLSTECEPGIPYYHYSFGMFLYRHRDLTAAESSLRKSLMLDPRNPKIHFALGRLLEEKGDIDAAVEEFERSLEVLQEVKKTSSGKHFVDSHGFYFSIEGIREALVDKLKTIRVRKKD